MAVKFMFKNMSLKWVLEHQFMLLKALLFVLMDLTGEVSMCVYVCMCVYVWLEGRGGGEREKFMQTVLFYFSR